MTADEIRKKFEKSNISANLDSWIRVEIAAQLAEIKELLSVTIGKYDTGGAKGFVNVTSKK